MKKLTLSIAALAIAFSATACGADSTENKPLLINSATSDAVQEDRTYAEAGLLRFAASGTKAENAKTFTDENFLMVSAEDKFAITSYGTTDVLALDGEKQTYAAEGEVFHVISYAYDYNLGTAIDFGVVINGAEAKPMPAELPVDGVLLVSAPEDAEIVIEATSDGGEEAGLAVQSIDVKTAERLTDNLEVWYKNSTASVQNASLRGEGGSNPYALTVTATVGDVFRSAYVESMGFAPKGSAFIYANVSDPSFELEKHGTAQQDGYNLVLTTKDGKTIIGKEEQDEWYVFTAPLAEDDFTIHAEASATITLTGKAVASVQGLATSKATVAF